MLTSEILRSYLLLPEFGTYSISRVNYLTTPRVSKLLKSLLFLSAQCYINFVKKKNCIKRFTTMRTHSPLNTQGNTSVLCSSTYFGILSSLWS